jgi:hypothetical protein
MLIQFKARINLPSLPHGVNDGSGSWPCKKTYPAKSMRNQDPLVSGCDRGHQRLGSDDVHDPCQIVGQDRESYLGGYFWKRFGEEVCRPHAGLHRAERMLDGLATLAHGERVRIKALLHGIEQVFMLPSWNSPLRPCRALGLERKILTGAGPVAPYPFAIFHAGKTIWQLLSSRTSMSVCLQQIDKVQLAETAIRLGARRLRLGQSYRDAGLVAGQDLRTARASLSLKQLSPAWPYWRVVPDLSRCS